MVKDKRIDLRLSVRDYEAIAQRAERCGMTISEFLRQAGLSYTTSPILQIATNLGLSKLDCAIVAQKAALLEMNTIEYVKDSAVGRKVQGYKRSDVETNVSLKKQHCEGQLQLTI